MKLISNHRQPITLDDGTVIAAAGTPGSTREASLSDRDRRRYVETGRLAVIEGPAISTASGSDRVTRSAKTTAKEDNSQ